MRGGIDNEYPITTNVTHSVLGDLTTGNMTTDASGQGCPPAVEGDNKTDEGA